MRYWLASIGILLLLAAAGSAGSFTVDMDVDTYISSADEDASFSESNLLWVSSQDDDDDDDDAINETRLGFENLFGSQGVFKPEQIKSATLTLNVARVDDDGRIRAYFLEGATLSTLTWKDKVDYDINVSSKSVKIEESDVKSAIELDVTPIIKKAVEVCAEGCPYSIVLVGEGDVSVAFVSSEASDEDKPVLKYVTEE
ncbi:MAG: DNRLRE domain-containing protein [Methanothrix sp.]|uniref:DNRLRE domain-containing protein n=1 Tax=Methanothrix sp. TaxID=90426 RepID=UPI0025CF7199|nr:DNRLRE domain-containing protein [Methanothrix sp.]MBK7385994.1 DNRLRE domain-containing protein [Methanothrix sp.]HPW73699.1 DNRLRE domain-containing protein [Methanothrix sp.]